MKRALYIVAGVVCFIGMSQGDTFDARLPHSLDDCVSTNGSCCETIWETAMKLYQDKRPKMDVSFEDRVLKAHIGPLPLSYVIQISIWLFFTLMITLLFGYLFSVLLFAITSWWTNALHWGVAMFLLAGIVLGSWCVRQSLALLLPYSFEFSIDTRMACYGTMLRRCKRQLSDDLILLVEPSYQRGDWGFTLRLSSGGRKYLLLPDAIVGSSYSRAISKARKLAARIQECVPYIVKIEESKYWRYH